jgi:hypothetical protein
VEGVITFWEYFGAKIDSPDATEVRQGNAREMLVRVNGLLGAAEMVGVYVAPIDPDTGTCISGAKGGAGDGGFRLQDSTTGGVHSRHKEGDALDVYDPLNALDDWLTDDILAEHGLFREAPHSTPGWCHLQSHPPGSGRHTFEP